MYSCRDCCEVFDHTTEYEGCPYCGSHRIWKLGLEDLDLFSIEAERTEINSNAREIRNSWGYK